MASKDENPSKNSNNEDDTSTEPVDIIPGYSKIEDFTKDGFKTLINASRNSNSLPQDRDWDFYNTHQSFRNLMTSEGNKVLELINDVLKQQAVFGNIKNRDLNEKIELIVEANDTILERVANNLDELSGIRKNPQLPVEVQVVEAELPVNGTWNKINSNKITVQSKIQSTQSLPKSPNSIRLLTGKNIQRPQKFFKDRIDNSKAPWEPRIKDKPNSLKPLAIFLEHTDDGQGEIFCHPYEFELERFEPSAPQLTRSTPHTPRPLADTPLKLIVTSDQLNSLLSDLHTHSELAIDLEHHSYRSYMGITCLMQISTPDTDYLIDTLVLRDQLHILNEIFTKKSVVKVFHGADRDIEWLQRDLSLYIVNMFDTHQAARQLGYPQLSLSYLLRKFCQLDADKHFQLADWRIRPLPEELQTYARSDTHYLLYIYHTMRNELLSKGENMLRVVIHNSTLVCRKRYEKPIIRDDSHLELYRRCKKMFDNRQMFALKHLYLWRDDLARDEDESTGFVLPNHMLLQIAELLPREMQGILACCNPIPPLVRANLLELHKIILKAREQSVIKPILSEETRSRGNTQQQSKLNMDTILNCPHDLVKSEEFRDDLPTLLGALLNQKQPLTTKKPTKNPKLPFESARSSITIFETPEHSDNEVETESSKITNKLRKLKFLGPYERYKLVKTYAQFEEEKQLEKDKQKLDKTTSPTNTEKSDNERISALQEHFKTLAAATAQSQTPPSNKQPEVLENQDAQPPNRKRKRSPSVDNVHTEKSPEPNVKSPKPKGLIKPPKKNKNKNKNKQTKPPENNQQAQQQQQRAPKRKHNNSNNQQQQQQQQSQRGGKRPKRNQNGGQREFRPFDYGAVDFRQFQGGAGSAHQPKNVRSNFKSRGSKNRRTENIGRTNTRSSTFGGRGNRGSR